MQVILLFVNNPSSVSSVNSQIGGNQQSTGSVQHRGEGRDLPQERPTHLLQPLHPGDDPLSEQDDLGLQHRSGDQYAGLLRGDSHEAPDLIGDWL